MLCPTASLLLLLLAIATGTPVDNNVEGEPEIECGATSVTVSFNTKNPFDGHVYVKGLYAQAGCRTDGTGQQRTGSIALPFDQCNTQRRRSLNPKGIFVQTTVIISFHPHFETKVDRAYKIQCFYMEADKTVSTELEVSMLTTGFQTQTVPMPVCRYTILTGGPNGQPVKYAIVGQPVYHKWTCDTETVNTFCMRVYGCHVDDGKGDRVDLLDAQGCAQDKYLLGNLEYPTDLMAGKEAHVFKYADRVALFFQCQIEITIKEPNGQCPKPACPEPAKGKRSAPKKESRSSADSASVIDVGAEISALDVDDTDGKRSRNLSFLPFNANEVVGTGNSDICLSNVSFGLFVSFVIGLLVVACILLSFVCFRRRRQAKL